MVQRLGRNKYQINTKEQNIETASENLADMCDFYQSICESKPDGYLAITREGMVRSANMTAINLLKIKKTELLNTNISRFFAPKYQKLFLFNLHKLFDTGLQNTLEIPMFRFDLTQFYARIAFSSLKIGGKFYDTCLLIISDISYLLNGEKFTQLFKTAREGILIFKFNSGEIIEANTSVAALFKLPVDRIIGQKIWEVAQLKFLAPDLQTFNSLKERDFMKHSDIALQDSLGQYVEAEIFCSSLLLRGEKIVQCHFHEICKYKNVERAMSERIKDLTLLNKIAGLLNRTVEINALAKISLESVLQWLDFPLGMIYLLDPITKKDITISLNRSADQEWGQTLTEIPSYSEIMQQLMTVKNIFIYPNIEHEKTLIQDYEVLFQSHNVKNLIGIPLTSHEKNLGSMLLISNVGKTLTPVKIKTLEILGSRIGRVIEHEQLIQRLNLWSTMDALTGIYNRRYFFDSLQMEINRSQHSNSSFSVLFMDIDGFKKYNDRFGHIFGDHLLNLLAGTMTAITRKSDINCRYGGDEFAVILPGLDIDKATLIADRIRLAFFDRFSSDYGNIEHGLGLSAGVVDYSDAAETPESLVFMADCALYDAKKRGINTTRKITEIKSLPNRAFEVANFKEIQDLAAVIDVKNQKAAGHSKRVSEIAIKIGQKFGMALTDLEKLRSAALVHDIGKIGIPETILNKTEKLTTKEWQILREHSSKGASLIGQIKSLKELAPVILYHHEWFNGTGYPDKLKGEDIPLAARIINIAEAYDTMVTPRAYRKLLSEAAALDEMVKFSGKQFDPELMRIVPEALNI